MTFALDLSRLVEKANGRTELVVRKVMLEAFRGVVLKSPVLSGRFRGNWVAGYNAPNTATTEATDKSGSKTVAKITSDVMAVRLSDSASVYLTNSLPYATKLEYGYSKKAPQGMVRLTLAEITSHYGT